MTRKMHMREDWPIGVKYSDLKTLCGQRGPRNQSSRSSDVTCRRCLRILTVRKSSKDAKELE